MMYRITMGFLIVSGITLCQAWTTRSSLVVHERRPWHIHKATIDDDSSISQESSSSSASIDGYEVTTKTRKQLVFDDTAGRFFETSNEPPEEELVTSEYTSDYVDELPSINYDTTKYAVTDMIPTEELMGGYQRRLGGGIPTTTAIVDMECQDQECDIIIQEPPQSPPEDATSSTSRSSSRNTIVEQCYDAWNRRDMAAAADCFDTSSSLNYQDSLYLGRITNKKDLEQHFATQAAMLPPQSRLVVDHMAVDAQNGNIATQWHVEPPSSSSEASSTTQQPIPYTRGISFYTTTTDRDKIQSGFRVSEMLVKPPKSLADALVSSASQWLPLMTSTTANSVESTTTSTTTTTTSSSRVVSIIETYMEAWNRRDMEAALDCFVDDCIYETEDPVFVDKLQGKAALRNHLQKNAASLPASCQIVLDRLAVDDVGTIGTEWHLEARPGMPIPNLRGCSMYTTDPVTGLLQTGFDVTEAPIKLPRQAQSLLSLPARVVFGF